MSAPSPAAMAVNRGFAKVPVWAVYLAGLLPLAVLVWQMVLGDPGADPVKTVEHRLGKVALWFLLGGLAITPLRRFAGVNLLRFRRAVGLIAAGYVTLHVVVWFSLDMGFLWDQALSDLWRRRYLLLGVGAVIALIPLVATSNDRAIRRLGANWRRLHRLVYVAASLGVVHYLWQMKVISQEGWLWLGALMVLLAVRIGPGFGGFSGPRGGVRKTSRPEAQ